MKCGAIIRIVIVLIVCLAGYNTAQTHKNINYAGDNNSAHTLDIYMPTGTGPFRAIVYIHGGAFSGGDKSEASSWASGNLTGAGLACVSINYRLSGEAIFPAQINDVKAAVRWLRANGSKYNLNTDKIGVTGTSAGGGLCAQLAFNGDVKVYTVGTATMDIEGNVGGNLTFSSRVQAAVDWFGPTNFLRMNDYPGQQDHNAADSPESKLMGAPIQTIPDKVMLANPITYVTNDDPPLLMIHGDKDPLVIFNQSELLYNAVYPVFSPIGKEVTLMKMAGGGHGGSLTVTTESKKAMVDFFVKYIKNDNTPVKVTKAGLKNRPVAITCRNRMIQYRLDAALPLHFKLFSITGRLIRTINYPLQAPGYYQLPIVDNTCSAGAYLLDCTAECRNIRMKLVIK